MKREYDFSKGQRGPIVPKEPGKTRVTIRLDNDVIEHFLSTVDRAGGGNYQTLINNALREYIRGARLETVVRKAVREEARTLFYPKLTIQPSRERSGEGGNSFTTLDEAIREASRNALVKALRATSGNLHRAADLLGVSRHTVSRMVVRHRLKMTSRDSAKETDLMDILEKQVAD